MGFFSELHDDLTLIKKKIAQTDELRLTDQELEQYKLTSAVVSSMIAEPELWEKSCLFNIHRIGDKFTERVENLSGHFTPQNMTLFYYFIIRFLAELNLSYQQEKFQLNLDGDLFKIINMLNNKMFYSGDSHPDWLCYAFYKMPIDILCFYMGNQGFKTFFEFDEKKAAIEKSITEHQDKVQKKIDEVNKLKEKLDEYKTAFNFVGLDKGFENLLKQKNEAKTKTFWLLIGLAIVTILPLGFSFYEKFIANVDILWQSMLPIIGLEFVLIYFFRVVLNHYHSIQTQIMQLELRQSLCEFIQSYADYAKKIKTDDKDALEKFENLIFSSILSNPDKVPGTFDGVEGLTSLLKELKK